MRKKWIKFLKGVHMGGSTFKDYLGKAQNVDLKNELKNIIESLKDMKKLLLIEWNKWEEMHQIL